jgi:hypothetical protein
MTTTSNSKFPTVLVVLNSNPSQSRPTISSSLPSSFSFSWKEKEEINDDRKTEIINGSGGERLQRKMKKGNTERRTLQYDGSYFESRTKRRSQWNVFSWFASAFLSPANDRSSILEQVSKEGLEV